MPNAKQLSPELTARIDKIYRSSNSVIFMTILGLFVPFLLIAFALLGLKYAFQKYQLLKKLDASAFELGENDRFKVKLLARRPIRFFAPLLVLMVWSLGLAVTLSTELVDVEKLIDSIF